MNSKIEKLSHTIINDSLKLKANERVLITTSSIKTKDLIKTLIIEISKLKAIPYVKIVDDELNSLISENASDKLINEYSKYKQYEVDNFDCFINIRYGTNDYISKNIPDWFRKEMGEASKKADDIRINQRRWTLLNYPSPLDAYKAKMTNEEFFNHALEVMTLDYTQMCKNMEPLKKLMEKTDMVHIVGPGTDLTFSIKNIPIIPCCGEANLPDGEIFTAPIKDSVNGFITYNAPSSYQGYVYHNIKLVFEKGKIIESTCDENNDALNKIFDTDEGSRFVGEFSLGLNPLILDPTGDILYDEKIIGSIHFTPGRSYKNADNGNFSSVHWDLVLIQREDYGGGQIYFDDVLIRDNGIFVLDELKSLNYNLK